MEEHVFTIDQEQKGTRIDVFICNEIEDLSRNSIQKLIEEQKVLVNKECCKANYKLRYGDIVTLIVPDPVEIEINPEKMDLNIIYEDKELIVLNKPQGIVVHPATGHYSGTLVNGLLYHCGEELSGINGVMRPGIVHRIDKDTSGILVIAKTNLAHQHLSKQLAEHSMTRTYHAIVFNSMKNEQGTIDKPIARHPVDRKRMTVAYPGVKNSKKAVTHFEVLNKMENYTYIKVNLETGRTHQIRVHMSHVGHPLVGDAVYGNSKQNSKYNGQLLHAKILGFIHPVKNEYMQFETDLPEYFCNALEKLKR